MRRALRRSSPDVDRRRTSSSEIRFNSSSRRERNAPTLAPPLSPAKERRLFQSLHQPRPPSILSALASREERGRRLDVENERGISPRDAALSSFRMPSLHVAELASSLRQALEPQRKPDMLVSFGRWALVQRESLAVRAASPMAVAVVRFLFRFSF